MNEDVLMACYKAFENDCYKYVIFSESNDGEISYYGMRNDPNIDYLYKEYYGEKFNRSKFHLLSFEDGKLNWVETFNFKTKMVEFPIDISDDVFLAIAKQAHEKNITFNDEVINIFKKYIDEKK